MNAVIACGGTGGHLFPGIAVAEVLRDRGHEVMLLVSEKEIDALALSGRTNFRFEKLPTVGLPSPFSPAILGFIRRFYQSFSLCRSIYRKFKPQVVLGMGGFTSTAPVLAGRMRGVSTFIHESNAIPGKANRLTARMVRAVMLGFKECAPFFPKARTEVTGTPIRTELKPLDREVARQRLGLRADLPTLLVMGGSQGASGINQAVIKSLPFLHGVPLQVIHLSGARDERLVADNYGREKIPAYISAFHHRMEEVYSAADLLVARAGAASLAEFAAFSLPSILIPFPYAADDHQTRNAEIYARAQAAILVKESEISGELLARKIRELIESPERIRNMSVNSLQLAPKNAAGLMVTTMEKYTTHEARL
ncbi:MAG: undecaprenyldiphospho-muramoylpentapeptide beta-N-acetylglucosaminyltransferase [Verrucomicrobia bacterium]|nr:MAG: undecaprenyldiphospho-muramoylpentapeptide beta-N-acetylglucosaminyltransferase [Verrucomicrobiota bacterium]PYJ50700.1 MAG: undecaprenyldiphospho-muramoylpentapeptide beta-N-acetylglucosaminyltransferase [Verrucomicrobiota bacterium]PYL70758.1 MAG: undecaprenyldiphospho-muramoylpentapeptide beta-N-acetylglucosaminyltransferase [Verrucomicrobiota bacterium]